MKFTTISVIDNKVSVDAEHLADAPDASIAVDKNILWYDIKSNNREEVVSFLNGFDLQSGLIEAIRNPGNSVRLQIFGQQGIADLYVYHQSNESKSCIVTIILLDHVTITISPENYNYMERVVNEWKIISQIKDLDAREMAFGFYNYVLDVDSQIASFLNQRIGDYSKKIIGKPLTGDIAEIEMLKQEVVTMLEVFEFQYTSFGLLPLHAGGNKERMEMLDKIVLGIEHLQRVMERADDRLDIIYNKYLYDLQSITNRKINTLTIIQSIFVPITFIAGVYGMNFINIPELSWGSGYMYALGLMGAIAVTELIIFYRNGWFK